jgi:amphi-Trp domain-containing protein
MAEEREIEKGYDRAQTAAKLRRLAEALDRNEPFEIQIAAQRVYVPADAEIVFEYERGEEQDELEVEIKWWRKKG